VTGEAGTLGTRALRCTCHGAEEHTGTDASARAVQTAVTHVDAATGRPVMVDVGAKEATRRFAHARARVSLPAPAAAALRAWLGAADATGSPPAPAAVRKGSPLHVAVVAGVMAAKRTSELIPLCHAVPLDKVDVELAVDEGAGGASEAVLRVECRAWATHRTGVEMEALVGATLAALTVYDMLKASSHGIRIERVELVEKTGGTRGRFGA